MIYFNILLLSAAGPIVPCCIRLGYTVLRPVTDTRLDAVNPARGQLNAVPAALTAVLPLLLCCFCHLQIPQLKAWVTDSSLEDDEFFKLSQSSKTKKTDWVKYVKKKLAAC
jgi:hypothetical protein